MSNNKILTVSYGTFSCTLEGFDDSFGTMKAIAEYFRDLASDDRYFGAEPPQPDAEMLARIAQKEISRRVEAREHDGKIVLSALEDNRAQQSMSQTAPPAVTAAAPAPAQVDHDDVQSQHAPVAEDAETEVADAPVPQAVAASAAEAEETPQAITADDKEPAAQVPDEVNTDNEGIEGTGVEETSEEEDLVQAQVAKAEGADADDENDIVPGQPDAEIEAFFAEMVSEAAKDEFEDATNDAGIAPQAMEVKPAGATCPVPDSIAAKLQRIRAVVAQHEEEAEEADYAEDQHAELTAAAAQTETGIEAIEVDVAASVGNTADAVMRARHDIQDALNADDAADQAMGEAELLEDEDDDEDYSALLRRLEQDDAAEAPAHADPAFDDDDAVDDTSETDDALANLFGADDLDADDDAEDEADTALDAPQPDVAQESDAPAPPPRARVIKVKRADLEAAIERGVLEEYDDEDEPSEVTAKGRALNDLAPAKTATSSLSPEDEQELARELAALEEDIKSEAPQGDAAPARPDAKPRDDNAAPAGARNVLPEIEDETTGDMSRLMAEADHQMDEPESATRRNAFAHLRAAVAAKKADAAIGIPDDTDEKGDAYRSDLAQVVRPRRPVSGAARTPRPEDARPAPLKLVAEQRIDVETRPRPAGPVRPRRVAAAVTRPDAPQADGASFVEFAEEMGATSLPELLEAAAAYMAFVEGLEQFSRPQLMTKVRQAGSEGGFSREDGLRSFGQLLRAGKIEKIKGGRFTVSDDIGFRPDQRAVG